MNRLSDDGFISGWIEYIRDGKGRIIDYRAYTYDNRNDHYGCVYHSVKEYNENSRVVLNSVLSTEAYSWHTSIYLRTEWEYSASFGYILSQSFFHNEEVPESSVCTPVSRIDYEYSDTEIVRKVSLYKNDESIPAGTSVYSLVFDEKDNVIRIDKYQPEVQTIPESEEFTIFYYPEKPLPGLPVQ